MRLDKVGDQIIDAFAAAQVAIVELASSTADVVEKLGQRARRPDQLEVEFGLSFTAKGNVNRGWRRSGSSAAGEGGLRRSAKRVTMSADLRMREHLGRILDAGGPAVGTCFQVAPGVLITAWHVLNDLEAGNEGATVAVDALDGASGPTTAEVLRVGPVHDLAVLRRAEPLSASISGISATDMVALGTEVVVTGVSGVDDPEHEYRFLDAPGRWAGGTTRDDQVSGILARARGDYDQAERHFQQSLQINWQLSDQAGIAATWSPLGNLAIKRRRYAEATVWHTRALLVGLFLQISDATCNLRTPASLRARMGNNAFIAAASTIVDEAQLAEVQALLDSLGADDSGEPEAE
jgi:Trypsin-like peptidase domain/Trypsin-co-occurring domain 1